jgi:hypothetical protein
MKQQPIKYLAVATPILLVTGLCLSARADMGAIYAQDSINMMTTTVTNYNNKMGVDDYVRRNRNSNRTSTRSSSTNQRTDSSKPATGTTFNSDPNISKQVQNSFISTVDNPTGKKFLTGLLTPENAKRLFSSTGNINPNDMTDIFAAASVYSFGLIEGKTTNTPQLRSTQQRFRKMFAKRSIGNATMQRNSESMMYWTMLLIRSKLNAEKSDTDALAMAKVRANASEMMTSIGLSPDKYTLGDRGFVEK